MEIVNILDAIENGGENDLADGLSTFSCPLNLEIEDFIRNKAIDFAKRKMSITYLLYDSSDMSLLGYFALAHKSIDVNESALGSIRRKQKLARNARYDRETHIYTISAFLLAQFGKNFSVDKGKRISGEEMMGYAEDVLVDIQRRIGGVVVYLDAEDRPELANFYENVVRYKRFDERYSDTDGTKYIQYMKFL